MEEVTLRQATIDVRDFKVAWHYDGCVMGQAMNASAVAKGGHKMTVFNKVPIMSTILGNSQR